MEDQYYQAVGAIQYQDGFGGVTELIWGGFGRGSGISWGGGFGDGGGRLG